MCVAPSYPPSAEQILIAEGRWQAAVVSFHSLVFLLHGKFHLWGFIAVKELR